MPASIKHLSDKKVCYYILLARWTDGLYYAAALTKVDKTKKTCRVAFEDGSEIWVSNRDVHIQMSIDQLSEDEDIVCCICDGGSSEPPNEIILCDVCQQGYHQKCHTPPVDSSKLDASEDTKDHKDWFCATCSYIMNQNNRDELATSTAAASTAQTPAAKAGSATPQTSKSRQPPALAPAVAAKFVAISDSRTPNVPSRQPAKVKQTPPTTQRPGATGVVKPPTAATHHQRSAPYYPLSNQVRAAVASSSATAALASMTASSALVVGSIAGRSKQDLVKQSNRAVTQRQGNDDSVLSPPKHAVRKSGVNFAVTPVKQSALPTATRSIPSPGTNAANNGASTKELAAPARPSVTQIISTPSGGTLSVLTSPSRQQHAQTKPAEPARIATVAPTVVKDTNDTVESRVPQQQQSTTTTNVTSSDFAPGKVTNNDSSESLNAAKKAESESVVHSTSDHHQRHITDSPQLEISFEHSPEQSMSSPVSNDHQQQDNNTSSNPTMNGNEERSKSTTVIVGGAGSQSG